MKNELFSASRDVLRPTIHYLYPPLHDTDGKSNQYPITYAAPALKNGGVQVYTVGIGSIDRDELRFIASDPDNEHVFILSSFRDAPAFVDFLSVVTCESKSKLL